MSAFKSARRPAQPRMSKSRSSSPLQAERAQVDDGELNPSESPMEIPTSPMRSASSPHSPTTPFGVYSSRTDLAKDACQCDHCLLATWASHPTTKDLSGKGTRAPAYKPTSSNSQAVGATVQFVTITRMPEYATKSIEELRHEDYEEGRTSGYRPPPRRHKTPITAWGSPIPPADDEAPKVSFSFNWPTRMPFALSSSPSSTSVSPGPRAPDPQTSSPPRSPSPFAQPHSTTNDGLSLPAEVSQTDAASSASPAPTSESPDEHSTASTPKKTASLHSRDASSATVELSTPNPSGNSPASAARFPTTSFSFSFAPTAPPQPEYPLIFPGYLFGTAETSTSTSRDDASPPHAAESSAAVPPASLPRTIFTWPPQPAPVETSDDLPQSEDISKLLSDAAKVARDASDRLLRAEEELRRRTTPELQKALDAERARVKELEAQLAKEQSERRIANAKASMLREERTDLRKTVEELQGTQERAKADIAEARAIRREHIALRKEHATLQKKFDTRQEDHEQQQRHKDVDAARLRMEKDMLKRQLETLKTRTAGLENDKAGLNAVKTAQAKEIDSLRRTLSDLFLGGTAGTNNDANRKRQAQADRDREAFERMSGREKQRTPKPQPPPPQKTATPLEKYNAHWDQLLSPSPSTSPLLTFKQFPWPTHSLKEITTISLSKFLFVGVEKAKRKQAVRDQLRRWHPDKFMTRGVLAHVVEKDHERVMQMQKEVVVCLNQLLQDSQ
ncbi:hypothetical protein EXIGLDRAFT_837995 [Exidia glandulosa HHB12029]|uniref:Uncharacterized protein n=1 Tax=Exidia glandulosa HHB12029 TaxID=1314781 RepID=A0A165G8I3_EXIGL|nr:hypothetical protein EXIGLDRAFT_837995 [Exidia glandulosa HHB12029]